MPAPKSGGKQSMAQVTLTYPEPLHNLIVESFCLEFNYYPEVHGPDKEAFAKDKLVEMIIDVVRRYRLSTEGEDNRKAYRDNLEGRIQNAKAQVVVS